MSKKNTSICYHCGCELHVFFTEENGFFLVKCNGCGLLFVKNRPSDADISDAHKQGKHAGNQEIDVTGSFDPKKIEDYRIVLNDLIGSDFNEHKTLLDIGCGYGEFMIAISEYSKGKIATKGTEPNSIKSEFAKQKGLDVHYFDIESHSETYDMLSLLNVYSHLPNPPEFLKTIKKLLKPNGEIILQTGDATNFTPKTIPRPLFLPDHLSFTNEEILIEMLEKLDFEIIKVVKYPFMKRSILNFGKEVVKYLLPKYTSRIRYYFKKEIPKTDMFVYARLKN